ncbi:Protein RKD1 [Striga hermonthica]|uniref:Protein RKD1 n=1 Tax=Striga hermonthica TaxID=68872 RepID=A0A9N7N569_STRHE|nr:Protein RKD1 [Striga hermonthica]
MQNGFVPDPQYHQQLVLLEANGTEEKKLTGKRRREEEENAFSSSRKLSRETISQYFYMPITRAARELNVGLTLLKKRCRELGIRRWPHRKLISLQTLIKNVEANYSSPSLKKTKEYGKEGLSEEGKLREHLQILEQEKRLLEEIPDMEMEDTTKRLRQAFFKANYKKRKLMGTVGSCSTKPQPSKSHNPALMMAVDKVVVDDGDGDKDDDEELFRYFLEDCFSL